LNVRWPLQEQSALTQMDPVSPPVVLLQIVAANPLPRLACKMAPSLLHAVTPFVSWTT